MTGTGYSSGKPFGPHSDIDFFIESDQLVSGLPTSDKIPGMVKPRVLMEKFPALKEWSKQWTETLGRDVAPAGFAKDAVPSGPQIR